MKTDILLLERDCPTCGVIKAILSLEAATNDDFRGKEDQELLVIASQSNRASIELVKAIGHAGQPVPLMITYDGLVLTDPTEIKVRLEQQRMAVEP